jgi:hypothetical protein
VQQKQQEELQKKLLEETEPQTLQQQENMSIKGQSARHLVMQKLMRKVEVRQQKQLTVHTSFQIVCRLSSSEFLSDSFECHSVVTRA